jgi:hypothetical protein
MRDRDKRRRLEGAAGAIDPFGVGRRLLPQHRLVPCRTGAIGVIDGKIGDFEQDTYGDAGPRRM